MNATDTMLHSVHAFSWWEVITEVVIDSKVWRYLGPDR